MSGRSYRTLGQVAKPVNTSAFVDTNPTDEPITSGLLVIRPKPAVSARIGYYIVRTARNRVVPSTTR